MHPLSSTSALTVAAGTKRDSVSRGGVKGRGQWVEDYSTFLLLKSFFFKNRDPFFVFFRCSTKTGTTSSALSIYDGGGRVQDVV